MKKLTIILLLCLLCQNGWGDNWELQHLIRDSDVGGFIWEDRVPCLEGEEHLFIPLPEEAWNDICEIKEGFKREVHWSGSICIKCRRIDVACAGNDTFRWVKKDKLKALEDRIKKLEENNEYQIYFNFKGSRIRVDKPDATGVSKVTVAE